MPRRSDASAGATRVTTVVGVILLVVGVGLTFALVGAMAADCQWAGRRDARLARQEVLRAYGRQAARADMAKELARLSKMRAKGELCEEEFQVLRSHYELAVATAHNPIALPSWVWRARQSPV